MSRFPEGNIHVSIASGKSYKGMSIVKWDSVSDF